MCLDVEIKKLKAFLSQNFELQSQSNFDSSAITQNKFLDEPANTQQRRLPGKSGSRIGDRGDRGTGIEDRVHSSGAACYVCLVLLFCQVQGSGSDEFLVS